MNIYLEALIYLGIGTSYPKLHPYDKEIEKDAKIIIQMLVH